jgi:TolA-binding protein
MDTTEVPRTPQQYPQPPRRRGWPRRLALAAGFVVTLLIGVGIGAAGQNAGISQATYNASQARVSSLRSQVSSLESQVSTLESQVSTLQTDVNNDNAALTTARNKAATARQTANANAAAAYRGREAALRAQQQQVASEQQTLKQELGQVQASSINADGTYIVGQDVKPGTYHTNGSGNTGANDCYYATLNSTNGSLNSIISNGNFDGPETISLSGVYAFQVNGPCTWVLVP